jgi:hypothetical protein
MHVSYSQNIVTLAGVWMEPGWSTAVDVSPRSKKGKVVCQKSALKRETHLLFPVDREKVYSKNVGVTLTVHRSHKNVTNKQKRAQYM